MKLYHYSKEKYQDLRSLEAQRPITAKEKREAQNLARLFHNTHPYPYYGNVSFMFDPITKDHWKFYPADHHSWFKGSELFEYTVNVSDLPDFMWQIVETPEITKARLDDSVSIKDYWKIYKDIILTRYTGSGHKSFEKASQEFIGEIREWVEYMASVETKEAARYQYAAGVPHAMLYPVGGVIQYQTVKPIRL